MFTMSRFRTTSIWTRSPHAGPPTRRGQLRAGDAADSGSRGDRSVDRKGVSDHGEGQDERHEHGGDGPMAVTR